MNNNPIISADNLSFSYNGETVLENVNLAINKDDFVWIVQTYSWSFKAQKREYQNFR